jgi:hypothetical protein
MFSTIGVFFHVPFLFVQLPRLPIEALALYSQASGLHDFITASLRLTFTMPNHAPSGNSHAYETTLPQFQKPCFVAIPHTQFTRIHRHIRARATQSLLQDHLRLATASKPTIMHRVPIPAGPYGTRKHAAAQYSSRPSEL